MTMEKKESTNVTGQAGTQHNNNSTKDNSRADAPEAMIDIEEGLNEEDDEVLEDDDPETLNLRGQGLKKLTRAAPEWQLNTTTLILDNNELQRLDNIHTFQCIEKVGWFTAHQFDLILNQTPAEEMVIIFTHGACPSVRLENRNTLQWYMGSGGSLYSQDLLFICLVKIMAVYSSILTFIRLFWYWYVLVYKAGYGLI